MEENQTVENQTVEHSKAKMAGLLIAFGIVDLLAATVISLQAPFYPEVAREKGASASEYGWVFAIFEMTGIFVSLIVGTKISVLGSKRVLISGILLSGVSTIIFGRLDAIKGSSNFIWSSMGVRVLEGIGEAAYLTGSFTMGILETFYGFGMIVGPSFGGVLYDAGGYSLPFMVMGGLLCTSAFIAVLVFRVFPTPKNDVMPKCVKPTAMLHLIRIPEVFIAAYGIVSTGTGMGFISGLLQPHLEQFELTKTSIGLVFLSCGGVYGITAPVWGLICDRYENPQTISLIGIICAIIGYFIIGPVAFLPFDTKLWITCLGLSAFGVGLSAIYVSSFAIMQSSAIISGYPDDLSTYGLVSGLWTSMVGLGYFLGPILGGKLMDSIGFRKGSIFVLSALFLHVLILGIRFIFKKWSSSRIEKEVKKCPPDPIEYCP